jgi:hypothetical protein
MLLCVFVKGDVISLPMLPFAVGTEFALGRGLSTAMMPSSIIATRICRNGGDNETEGVAEDGDPWITTLDTPDVGVLGVEGGVGVAKRWYFWMKGYSSGNATSPLYESIRGETLNGQINSHFAQTFYTLHRFVAVPSVMSNKDDILVSLLACSRS